jgi:hypothetical protein
MEFGGSPDRDLFSIGFSIENRPNPQAKSVAELNDRKNNDPISFHWLNKTPGIHGFIEKSSDPRELYC